MTSFRPLYLILLLAGTEPIKEPPQSSWWGKVNVPGALLCGLQVTLTFWGYLKESERTGATAHLKNNINRMTIMQKMWFTIIIPFVYILTKFYHMRHLELFHSNVSRSDEIIRKGATGRRQPSYKKALQRLEKVTWRWNVISALGLIPVEVITVYIGILYTIKTTTQPPDPVTVYFYHLTIVIFMGTALDIAVKLTGVEMRLQILLEMQTETMREITRMELDKKRVSVLFKC